MADLPTQITSFIGRTQEIAAARERLLHPDIRLVTFTGPGGIGKTRLALQLAQELLDTFPDGTYFVSLAAINDPNFVASTIAQALEVQEVGATSLLDTLKQYLHAKHLLLILDNFEQLLEAAPLVAELLSAALQIKVLVTSRIPLHISGEHEYPVPSFALPNPKPFPQLESLSQYEAVTLFLQRAQAVKSDFQITSTNAPAVAEICVRLDGLPLAIELAAARIKMLTPETLLARLSNRLKLLTGGDRNVPARQQTLRNTIDWGFASTRQPVADVQDVPHAPGPKLHPGNSRCCPRSNIGRWPQPVNVKQPTPLKRSMPCERAWRAASRKERDGLTCAAVATSA